MKYLRLITVLALPLLISGRGWTRCAEDKSPIPQSMYDVGSIFGRNYITGLLERSILNEMVIIPTYMHFVSSSKMTDDTVDSQLNRQLEVLNQAYKTTGFRFQLEGITRTNNQKWSKADIGSPNRKMMKMLLRNGTYNTLNLYFVDHIKGGFLARTALGHCTAPVRDSWKYDQDGCVILTKTMPGGTMEGANLGYTTVHEVGHFLGLFHVFEGHSCDGPGDLIDDTPVQAQRTVGCPGSQNSCPNLPGVDSIHNFMDYSDDSCMDRFTEGQIARMKYQWRTSRAGK